MALSRNKVYVFQESTMDQDSDTVIPFGPSYIVGAKSVEDARKDLPESQKGYFWYLVSIK